MNRLFDDTDDLVGQVKKPIETAGNLFASLAAGVGIAHLLKKGKKESGKWTIKKTAIPHFFLALS